MAELQEEEHRALQVFKTKVTNDFGERLISIHLFGSKAREDAHQDSDIDVLVTLDQRSWQDEKRIFSLVTQTFLETNIVLSPKIFSTEEIATKRERNNMFFQAIDSDLVKI